MPYLSERRLHPDLDHPLLQLMLVDTINAQENCFKDLMKRCFRTGDAIEIVTSLEAADRQLAGFAYDCVILSVDADVTDMLKIWSSRYPDMPVVVHTSLTPEYAMALMRAGAEDCIDAYQPSPIEVHRVIRYAVGRRLARNYAHHLAEALDKERELNLLQREFIALVTHEFRTPLAIIHNAEQMLRMRIPPETLPLVDNSLAKIGRCLDRLRLLVDNIILCSRLEEGQDICQPLPLDIQSFLSDIVSRLHEVYTGARIELRIHAETSFYGDPSLCEHIFNNILSNALKYSLERDKVLLEVIPHTNYCSIRITDKGLGMSEKDIARLGEKFFRSSRVKHISGSGLGMHLTCRFMDYHKGWMIICSEEDAGTIIDLRFPLSY